MKQQQLTTLIKNNSGLTVGELLIGIALTLMVSLGAFQILTSSNKITQVFDQNIEARIEQQLGDKLILRDLRNSGASMNVMTIKDDCNKNFFDYETHRGSFFYLADKNRKRLQPEICKTGIARSFTLRKSGNLIFYFLVFDEKRGKGIFTEALTFYSSTTTAGNNVNLSAVLTYQGLNYNNYLTKSDEKNESYLNTPGKMLLVDSSVLIEGTDTQPTKSSSFVGNLKNSGVLDIAKISAPVVNSVKVIDYKNYFNDANGAIVSSTPANFNEFLMYLPSAGANGASVRIKPVTLIRYNLNCPAASSDSEEPPPCILYRTPFDPETSSFPDNQKVQVLRGYEKITFTRSDIANSIFKISYDKKENSDSGTTE